MSGTALVRLLPLALAVISAPARAPAAKPRAERHEKKSEAHGDEQDQGQGQEEEEEEDGDQDAADGDDKGQPGGAKKAPRSPNIARKEVAPLVERLLADERFTFCHDPRYPLTKEELGWCALAPPKDPRCPAFHEVCSHGANADLIERRRSFELSFPELPLPGRAALWTLLGLAAAFVVVMIARQSLAQRPPPDEAPAPDPAAAERAAAAAKARIVETDVARLLERAAAAAAAGDYRRAIADAYAALLRRLEGADVVRVEPHRTNGDHLRDVTQKLPAVRQEVAQVIRAIEEVEFGGQAPTADRFSSVRARVLGVLAAPLAALLVVLGLGGMLAGCRSERPRWEDSPSGRAAVLMLLRSYGFEARERFTSLAKVDQAVDQLIVTPRTLIADDAWKALDGWVAAGGTLVVAGLNDTPAWIGIKRAPEGGGVSSALEIAPRLIERLGRLRVVLPAKQTLADKSGSPVLSRGGAPYAVEKAHGVGRIFFFADDRLFTNAALLIADNARFLTELARMGGPRVEVAGELTGLAAATPLASVARGRLAPLLCQLAALALLFFLFKGAHFGRPSDPATARRRAFSEHARAVGVQYAHARASRLALELYGAYAFERLRDRLNVGGARSLTAMAEAVAARTDRPLGAVMRILVEARDGAQPQQRAAAPDAGGVGAAAADAAGSPHDLTVLTELAALVAETNPQGRPTGPPTKEKAQ